MNKIARRFALLLLPLFAACSLMQTPLPDFGTRIPENVATTSQVKSVVHQALISQGWHIIETSPGVTKASKKEQQYEATIYVVYGYRGYDIEYDSSKNLQYNPQANTIAQKYISWIYSLDKTIKANLKESA